MSNESSGSNGGIGFAGLLTILFIGLKLTHYIDWSWWWVLSPLWIAVLLVVGISAAVFAVAVIRDGRSRRGNRHFKW